MPDLLHCAEIAGGFALIAMTLLGIGMLAYTTDWRTFFQ